MTGTPPEMDSFDVPPPKPSKKIQVELIAPRLETVDEFQDSED